jgi:hypothetical protein
MLQNGGNEVVGGDVSCQGELWTILLMICVRNCPQLPRTRIRLSPELALEFAPPIHSDPEWGRVALGPHLRMIFTQIVTLTILVCLLL